MATQTKTIELRDIDELKPYPKNARTHSEKQIRQIAKSIERFQFLNPVLVDDDDTIIAGRIQHRNFLCASGEMSKEAFTEFLQVSFQRAAQSCRNGAIAYVCSDWRHIDEMSAAGHASFTELKNLCVWVKTNGGMGTFYRSKHELVFVWKIGNAPHVNTFGLGDKGRYRTNVWSYAGVNSFKSGRMEELASHPTVKPTALVADAIRDVSHRGDIVIDPFAGSGTTLVAAQQTGRIARLIELDPGYCDVVVRRFQDLTGARATLVASGEAFERTELCRNGGWTTSLPSSSYHC